MIGPYLPGISVLHRTPAGFKMLLLVAAIVLVCLLRRPWEIGAAAAVAGILAATAGCGPALLWHQIRPLRWVVPLLFALQWWLVDWQSAVLVCGGLVVTVALAAIFTMTTRVTAVLDAVLRVVRPLRKVGVDPDRVGLVLALTIRCVPLMSGIVDTVADARKARGAGFSLKALAAPVLVRALRTADGIGEALIARGFDD